MNLAVHPATPERWGDLVELFERRGPRGGWRNAPAYGCWCMYWRVGNDYRKQPARNNRNAFRAVVEHGPPPGLLAFDGTISWIVLGTTISTTY